jgi:hypothetical protein
MGLLDITSNNPFDEDSFVDFLGVNELSHQTINEFMQRKGLKPTILPLNSDPRVNQQWLQDHWVQHQNEFLLLGLGIDNLPDLSVVDFNDEEQYLDWMQQHASVHDYVNSVLGITS